MTEPVPVDRAPSGGWRRGVVREVANPTRDGRLIRIEVPDRIDHWPGQHYVVRLKAPDGYTASRSYSVASDPADALLELFIERLPDGEVSGYLADVASPGDELEIRGPIGGWFVWRADGPAVCIGGGSGVVPLVAMLRYASRLGRLDALTLAVAARTLAVLPYAEEFRAAGALIGLSREALGQRQAGRLTEAELGALLVPAATYFVCGSASFAESVSRSLVDVGVADDAVRVERFGPSG